MFYDDNYKPVLPTLLETIVSKLNKFDLNIISLSKEEYLDTDFSEIKTFDENNINIYICSEKLEYERFSKKNIKKESVYKFPIPICDLSNYNRELEKYLQLKFKTHLDAYGGGIIYHNNIKYNLLGTYDCVEISENQIAVFCSINEDLNIELVTLDLDRINKKIVINQHMIGTIPEYLTKDKNWLENFQGKRGLQIYPDKKLISVAHYSDNIKIKSRNLPLKSKNIRNRIYLKLRNKEKIRNPYMVEVYKI